MERDGKTDLSAQLRDPSPKQAVRAYTAGDRKALEGELRRRFAASFNEHLHNGRPETGRRSFLLSDTVPACSLQTPEQVLERGLHPLKLMSRPGILGLGSLEGRGVAIPASSSIKGPP